MAVTPERMTLAEFLKLPEAKPALELRQGMVSQKVLPSGPHGSIQFWLGAQIYNFAQLSGLAQGFTETRLVLGTDTYVPDLMVYLWARVPEDAHGDLPFFFTTPPDLAIEILSPGQTVRTQLDRCRELVGHGARVVVLADPERRAVYVVRAGREVGPLHEGDAVDVTDVFAGLQVDRRGLILVHPRPPHTSLESRR